MNSFGEVMRSVSRGGEGRGGEGRGGGRGGEGRGGEGRGGEGRGGGRARSEIEGGRRAENNSTVNMIFSNSPTSTRLLIQ